jgi:dolichol-phosphate mannosyltransferase
VYAVRRKRKENLVKRIAYAGFYRLIQRLSETALPLDSGDFSIMDRRVADLLSELPERNRYVRGLRAWAGFRQKGVEYEREKRFAGSTKYDLHQLVKLAYDGIFSFSDEPLRIAMRLGRAVAAVASVLAVWTFLKRVLNYEVFRASRPSPCSCCSSGGSS